MILFGIEVVTGNEQFAIAFDYYGILLHRVGEYWRLGCKVLNLPGTDVSTWLDGLKARASRAHARLKSIGVPTP